MATEQLDAEPFKLLQLILAARLKPNASVIVQACLGGRGPIRRLHDK